MQGKLGNFFAAQLSLAALVSSTLTCFPIATTLRLRCVWKWVDETKTWVGLGNPCNDNDRELFAAATVVKIGNGEKPKIWNSSCLDGICSKDFTQKIYAKSKRKKMLGAEGSREQFFGSTKLTLKPSLACSIPNDFSPYGSLSPILNLITRSPIVS
jgi:hypothetical protein